MTADFMVFNDQIINKRDILKIHKVYNTRGKVCYGIRLVIRGVGEVIEWYYDDPSKRNKRFETLISVLC